MLYRIRIRPPPIDRPRRGETNEWSVGGSIFNRLRDIFEKLSAGSNGRISPDSAGFRFVNTYFFGI